MAKKQSTALKGMFNHINEEGRDSLFGTSTNLPRIIEVDLSHLHPNPEQPRKAFDEERIRELAISIERHGLLQPITVMFHPEIERDYVVVAGERRYRAHQLLNRETIPAIVTNGNPDELTLIENIQRENLSPLEEAQALQRMIDRYSYTQEELARILGKNHTTVSHTLKLNTLPATLKKELATSQVPKSILVEISKLDTAKAQLDLWQVVKQGNLTVREVRTQKKKEKRLPSSPMKQLLALGHNFAEGLEQLAHGNPHLTNEDYDALIGIYKRISVQLQHIAQEEEKLN